MKTIVYLLSVIILLSVGLGCKKEVTGPSSDPTLIQAQTYFKTGNVLRTKSECPQAIIAYDTAIALNPTFSTAYYYRGECHKALGNLEKALDDYAKAVSLTPRNSQALFRLAELQVALNRFQDAILNFEKITEIAPDSAIVYLLKASIEERLGNNLAAVQTLTQGLTRTKAAWQMYAKRGRLYFMLRAFNSASIDLDTAITIFNNLRQSDSVTYKMEQILPTYLYALRLYNRSTNYNKTIQRAATIERFLTDDSSKAIFYSRRGIAEYFSRQFSAIKTLNIAKAFNKGLAETDYLQGLITLLIPGNESSAVQFFDLALSKDSNLDEVLVDRALANKRRLEFSYCPELCNAILKEEPRAQKLFEDFHCGVCR